MVRASARCVWNAISMDERVGPRRSWSRRWWTAGRRANGFARMAGAHMSSRAVGAHGGHQSSLPSEAVPNHVGTCVTGLSCQRALVGVTVARRSLGLRESRNPSAPLATDEVVDDPCGIYSWPY